MSKQLKFSSTNSTATKQSYISNMTDIDFSMNATNYDTGVVYDMSMLSVEDSIKQSLINILKLSPGSNVLFPETGYDLTNLIFKQVGDVAVQRAAIKTYITNAEPRISVVDFTVDFVTNEFNETEANFTLQYRILDNKQLYTLNVNLQNNLNNY